MHSCLLVIALKPFSEAKSRLAAALDSRQREHLARALFVRTEQFFASAFAAMPRLVVTAEKQAAALLSEGTQLLYESHAEGLNAAAEKARLWALERRFRQLLLVAADVPLWRRSEVLELLQAARTHDLALARAHDGGSNALLLRLPATGFAFAYGEGSAAAHQHNAAKAGLSCQICDLPLLSRDLDVPDDLLLWQAKQARRVLS